METIPIDYIDADEAWRERIRQVWGETAANHMHLDNGFSILALVKNDPAGLISVNWQLLPAPLASTYEAFIDIIEVATSFRRRGIASQLVKIAVERARQRGVYQLRAWSSDDKVEAIPLWQALGFGLCPASTYPAGKKVDGYFAVRVL
ncbi:MAG: GNAT family N-acetyltransferase [Chloroflexota bacterium]|jgi:GNAT superfamily N-acetyltransferase